VTSSQLDVAENISSSPTPVVGDFRDKEAPSVHDNDDKSAQFELERKKRRRLNCDLSQRKKGVNAIWIKRVADSKIEWESVLSRDRKPIHKMARDTTNNSSKRDEVCSRKTTSNS
jgi:hypothetical protein